MARRVYKAPVYPIETQIVIAVGVLAQYERAVIDSRKEVDFLRRCQAEGRAPAFSSQNPTDRDVRRAEDRVRLSDSGLEIATSNLNSLRAQATVV
jgi:hypothetical protein